MAATDIPWDNIYIRIGRMFSKTWPLTDGDTGLAGDPTGWKAACEVRTEYGGPLITRFHTIDVAWDGLIAFDGVGNMTMTLSDAKTALLAPIANARYDVMLIDPAGKHWPSVEGHAFVIQEATTDA